jgi:hypothetical protein
VKLGDDMNGFVAEGRCATWADVEEWLAAAARIHYPNSVFARGLQCRPRILRPNSLS